MLESGGIKFFVPYAFLHLKKGGNYGRRYLWSAKKNRSKGGQNTSWSSKGRAGRTITGAGIFWGIWKVEKPLGRTDFRLCVLHFPAQSSPQWWSLRKASSGVGLLRKTSGPTSWKLRTTPRRISASVVAPILVELPRLLPLTDTPSSAPDWLQIGYSSHWVIITLLGSFLWNIPGLECFSCLSLSWMWNVAILKLLPFPFCFLPTVSFTSTLAVVFRSMLFSGHRL